MMKKLLLLLVFVVQVCVAQVANPAPDLNQCGNEVFDLTVQTAVILGAQDPQDFTVSYHLSMADADANENAIAQPSVFNAPQSAVIFARVTENSSGNFAVASFNVSWDGPVQASLSMFRRCKAVCILSGFQPTALTSFASLSFVRR